MGEGKQELYDNSGYQFKCTDCDGTGIDLTGLTCKNCDGLGYGEENKA